MMLEARTTLSSRKKANPSAPTRQRLGQSRRKSTGHVPCGGAPSFSTTRPRLQLLQQAKFEKALVGFEKLLGTAPPPLAERCRMYLTACHRELGKAKLVFATPEEQYDYAVSLLNTDFYEEAREQFNDILRGHPAADFALYGLAVLDAITGQVEECLEHLSKAIGRQPAQSAAGAHRYRLPLHAG